MGSKNEALKIGKHMTAVQISSAPKGPYQIKDKHGWTLGTLEWYAPWAQYVFSPRENSVFSHDCLSDLSDFARKITRGTLCDTRS